MPSRAVVSLALLAPAVLLLGALRADPPQAALRSLESFPANVELDGPRAAQRLGVLGTYADGRCWDLTRTATFTSSAPSVASVDARGIVRAAGDGAATITVKTGGASASIPVRVKNATADVPVSFTREVVPVLTRAGCNQGACHGSQHGRGGFKLSLLGFDALFDYAQIVQSAKGRRVVLSDPDRSILLLKPTLTMDHGGGERFPAGSPQHLLWRARAKPG
jgi:hypothetical protein